MDRIPDTPDEVEERGLDSNPGSPGSYSSQASTPLEGGGEEQDTTAKRLPSLRSMSDPQNMNPNSTPLGTLSNARRPPPTSSSSVATGGALSNSDAMLKARALAANRMGMSPASSNSPASRNSPGRSSPVGGGLAGGMRLPPGAAPGRPCLQNTTSAPSLPKPGLSARRKMNLNINDISGGAQSNGEASRPANPVRANGSANISQMDEFKKYIDAEKGWLTFEGAATLTNRGVDFKGGRSFRMSLEDVIQLEELGKGNYGTVYRVQHAPSIRFKDGPSTVSRPPQGASEAGGGSGGFTGKVMAMKQIRLELDEARLTTILKELVILHECVSPYIIDFYGAFFQEGAVYMCIEYMDGGSVDKLYAGGVPEDVLRRIAHATIRGLKALKEEHNIIHRDVKPTNILVNRGGQVKICDFGVSGNLVASIAKTNIGCQSYMAPERIKSDMGSNADGSYSVQSDIWSLGLTVIECALGKYPYPPEVASTIFSQLAVSSPTFFYPLLSGINPLTGRFKRPSSTVSRPTCPQRATRRQRASSYADASTRRPGCAPRTTRCSSTRG